MEKITHENLLIAIVFKKFKDGAVPLTDHYESLQLVAFRYPKGRYTKAHIHKPKKRTTQKLQECLIVINGKIKVDLYAPNKKLIKSVFLSNGEAIIFINGAHGVLMLEKSEIFEIKNGPFFEDKLFIV